MFCFDIWGRLGQPPSAQSWVPLSQGPDTVGDFPRGQGFSFLSMLISQWASHCHPAVTDVTLLSGDYRVFLPCPLIVGFVARYSSHEALRSLQWDTLWAARVTNLTLILSSVRCHISNICETQGQNSSPHQVDRAIPECLSWILHGWSDCLRNYQLSYFKK